jgi:site-specific DNA recombinase
VSVAKPVGADTEALDRISRSFEIGLFRDGLAFLGVRLFTVADGEVSDLHIGLRGTINKMYVSDLAAKTKRGQLGRVKAGLIPGGRCYGYDPVPGEPGRRVVNQAQAEIVQRIFREYDAGRSPLEIVKNLNREGIPSPRGGKWNASTLSGSRKRANGILSNSLYVGRLKYDRQSFKKDPENGRRQARPNDPAAWIEKDVIEQDLRIIDGALWEAVQTRRAVAVAKKPTQHRRPRRTLSGLLRCGVCGESYIVVQGKYIGCSAVRNKGTCDNRRLITMTEVEERVLAALREHLLSPPRIELAVETYRKEREQRAREHAKERGSIERELSQAKRTLDLMMKKMLDGFEVSRDEYNAVARRRRELEAKLPLADKKVVSIHPQAAQSYRAKVEEIQAALTKGDAAGQEAVELVRSMIDRIVITPQPEKMGLEVFGDLAVLLGNGPGPDNNAIGGCGGPQQPPCNSRLCPQLPRFRAEEVKGWALSRAVTRRIALMQFVTEWPTGQGMMALAKSGRSRSITRGSACVHGARPWR